MSPKDRMKLFQAMERNTRQFELGIDLSWNAFKRWIEDEGNQWKLATCLPSYPLTEGESMAVKRLQKKLDEPTDWIRFELGSKLLPKGFGHE